MKIDLEERYLSEAGYERAAWRRPTRPHGRATCGTWIKGLLLAAAPCLAIVLVASLNAKFGPHEATARMERVLAQLDRMNSIRPETAQAIMRIISQPGYDCAQVPCDAELTTRNLAVRFRLATVAATKAQPREVEVSVATKPRGK